jgi:hypothetical protein
MLLHLVLIPAHSLSVFSQARVVLWLSDVLVDPFTVRPFSLLVPPHDPSSNARSELPKSLVLLVPGTQQSQTRLCL